MIRLNPTKIVSKYGKMREKVCKQQNSGFPIPHQTKIFNK